MANDYCLNLTMSERMEMVQRNSLTLQHMTLLILLFIFPLVFDAPGGQFEYMWLIYIVPVLLTAYVSGLKGGLITAALCTFIHVGWELREHRAYDAIYNHHNFLALVVIDVTLFAVAASLGSLAEKIKGEKKRAAAKDDELNVAVQQLKNSLDSIADGYISLDGELRFTYINKEAAKYIPVPVRVLIGQKISDTTDVKFSAELVQRCREAWESKQPATFERYSDLAQAWCEFNLYPSPTGLIVIIKDISERVETFKALQFSKDIFAKVFSASPVPMLINRLDNAKIVGVNDSFEVVTGYTREEVMGHTSDSLNMTLNFRTRLNLYEGILSKGYLRNVESEFITKRGEVRTGLFSFELVTLGDEPHILGVCIDITDLKLMQAEMAKLDRLNLIGVMAAGLGHEIRNPLTTVRGFLQLLGKDEKFSSAREYFKLMISEMDQMNAIVTEFLSLAKTKVTDVEILNLNYIIKKMQPLILADTVSSEMTLRLDLLELPDIEVNEKEIRQLVLNLVRNGLEAMNSRGVLSIRTFSANNQVVLAVQDQGKGISKEVMARLGTPFFTTKDTGTGLGLAVCYGIAKRHNAVIEVESDSNGTTFYVKFELPVQLSIA